MHHVDENSLRAKETDRLAVRHRRVTARVEESPIGLDLGAVHSDGDVLGARESGHLFIQIVGNARM
jgi:hypothetical protein